MTEAAVEVLGSSAAQVRVRVRLRLRLRVRLRVRARTAFEVLRSSAAQT